MAMSRYNMPGWLQTANRHAVKWSVGLPHPKIKRAALWAWTAALRGALKLGIWEKM